MHTLRIQTDLFSLLAVVVVFGIIGAVGMWLFLRRKRRGMPSTETDGKQILYLVFSRLSHRLKTAGEVIRGHLHGFSDELPKDAERWRVARRAIGEEASDINSLIERLDVLVRLGMAGQPLIIEPVNVPRLLEDLMVNLGPAADAKGIVLGGIVGGPMQNVPHISGDASALREMFSNLLENAVKHNSTGTEVTAEVRQQDNRLLVRIADTGKGLSPEVLSQLFDRASPNYHPRVTKGGGMGLYLCKLLVELHNGEIAVTSVEGKGTEFRILLPLRRTQ